jgi:hypothetical protein
VTRPAIPLADAGAFRSAERRTRLLRTGLALALLGTLAAAFLLAQGPRARAGTVSGGTSTVAVLDVSWSTSSSYGEIARALRQLASSGRRLGLVVFSDVAYEMLPTGTPAVELRPLLRFFTGSKRRLDSPWATSLSGGTRISAALSLARDMLHGDGSSNGSVILVSDLGDSPNDRAQLTAELLSYVREGIPLRVVGIDPTPENDRFFQGLLQSRPLRVQAGRSSAIVQSSSSSGLPVALVAVAALLLVLLAVNEHACARLTWSTETR